MKQKIILVCAILLTGLQSVKGQSIWPSTVNAAGGSGTVAGSTFDWSVGEMAIVSTFTSPSFVVTQGMLQPLVNDLSIEPAELNKYLRVFPNPTDGIMNIELISLQNGSLCYKLMDVTGKILVEKNTSVKQGTNTLQLDMAPLAPATYMLQVSSSVQGMAGDISYKIQKVQ
jgi:hypothetical protein